MVSAYRPCFRYSSGFFGPSTTRICELSSDRKASSSVWASADRPARVNAMKRLYRIRRWYGVIAAARRNAAMASSCLPVRDRQKPR